MRGNITIHTVSGARYEIGDWEHKYFMELYTGLEQPGAILVISGSHHTAVNKAHILSIEWKGI